VAKALRYLVRVTLEDQVVRQDALTPVAVNQSLHPAPRWDQKQRGSHTTRLINPLGQHFSLFLVDRGAVLDLASCIEWGGKDEHEVVDPARRAERPHKHDGADVLKAA
jgi:hypothetical protein